MSIQPTPRSKAFVLAQRITACYEGDTVKPVYTPPALAEEMVAKLPSLTGNVLVISDLGLLAAVVKRLKTEGLERNKVTFVAHTEKQENFSHELSVNTWQIGYNDPIKELEKKLMGLKFDVIVGNPPYQMVGTSGKKLWTKFFHLAFDVLNPNGQIQFLTPSSFLLRTGSSVAKIREAFQQRDILHISFDATKYFNVGENIVFSHVRNTKLGVVSEVKYNGNVSQQDLSVEVFPYMDDEHRITIGIMRKVAQSKHDRLPIREDINNSQKAMVDRGELSKIKNKKYRYPVIYTPNTIHYAAKPFGDGEKLRLMLTLAGTYYSEKTPDRNIFVTTSHSGQGMVHILIPSAEVGMSIKSYLTKKLFRFFIQAEKTSGYNTGIAKLPLLDLSEEWTDNKLYAHFGLTENEIDLVERNVK